MSYYVKVKEKQTGAIKDQVLVFRYGDALIQKLKLALKHDPRHHDFIIEKR